MKLSVNFDNAMLSVIRNALREDIGMGDVTTQCTVSPDLKGKGEFIAKANGVIAGLDVAEAVFGLVDDGVQFRTFLHDGDPVLEGTKIAEVEGWLASILTAERTALNFLQRMSGIATTTTSFLKLVEGTSVAIMDTRKTVPGLRAFDKLAVRLGRGTNHRFGLDDMILIKDNHIAAAGGIKPAIEKAVALRPTAAIKVEVETDTLDQVRDALECDGVDVIMLDNYSLEAMREAVALIRAKRPQMKIEASGNVRPDTVRAIAETGVDMISVGALTHSVKALDISLDVKQAASSD